MSRKRKRPQGHPAGRTAPRPGAAVPAGRTRVEAVSVPWLQRLGRVPRLLLPLVVGLGVLAALFVDSRWSALALLPALGLMGWLSYLAWPHLTTSRRAVRAIVLGALTAWVVVRLATG